MQRYLALVFFIVACNASNGPTNAIATTVDSSCKVGAGESPFACVAKKCVAAGGSYLAFNQTCDCGREKVFVGWGNGSCEPVKKTNACLEVERGFTEAKEESMDRFIECLTLHQKEGLSVHLAALQDLDSLANWADQKLEGVLSTIQRQPTLFQILSVNWMVGPGGLDSLDEVTLTRLTTPFTVLLTSPKESNPAEISFYFEKNDDVRELFTPQENETTIVVENVNNSSAVKPIRDVAAHVLQRPFVATENHYFTDDGCAGHCQLRQEIEGATRRRDYVAGQLLSDHILVWESPTKERAKALVQLLPSGQISLVHVYEPKYEGPTESVSIEYQIYDRHWKPLLSKTRSRTVLPAIGKFSEGLTKTTSASDNEPQAILCESGFDLETMNRLGMETFVLGPMRSRSFFGWVDSGRNLENWGNLVGKYTLAGISEFTDSGVRLPFVSYNEHAVKVGRKLTGFAGDIRLLPISLGICSDHGDRWIPQVKASSRAKVMNWSAALSYTKGACSNSPFGQQILKHENDLLYVVAAGNDGLNGDASPIPVCPQSLSGAANLIVVAAGSGSSLSYVSNYGVRFADIVADGSHYEQGPQSYTTSLAAPDVTRLAALLSYEYPGLTPRLLRKSILFGANIPTRGRTFTPFPVRSGGWLDANLAQAFAALYSTSPNIGDREALKKVYCDSSRRQHCAFLNQRIQILTNNSLLGER